MRRTLWLSIFASLLAILPLASQATDPVRILVLSGRADLVTGGDALIAVVLPTLTDPADVTVTAGVTDVTTSFAVRDGLLVGLVTGLAEGETVLTAKIEPGGPGAQITLKNHPIGGPVFSGPQVQPWLCTTAGNGLGAATDGQCNAPTKYDFFYKSTNPARTGLIAYDTASPPADVANTTTDQGVTVPYIVRRERGTANRGIYDIAVLYPNPSAPYGPFGQQAGWNNKLFYVFGASCGTLHTQASPESVLNDAKLSRGFMVATSSLNILGNNCNTVTSAESAMMLKERIAEQYGAVRYTIGTGCSGGLIGQHMVGNAYPGIVDGIQPNCSYEDNWSTGNEVVDCHLLVNYFARTSPHLWLVLAQQALVNGHLSPSSCVAWEGLFAPVADPEGGCGLPPEQDYHPQNNPEGCRGTLADYMISVVGARPQDGFANLPYDNVGIQYGLNALNSRLILPEQFVDLNEKIGSVDIDFNFAAGRRTADPAIATLYRNGLVNDGNQLDQVAMIDLRGTSNLEIHTDFHTYSMRARLDKANGHHDNHVIWTSHIPLVGDPAWTNEAFLLLDRWLTAVEADTSNASRAEKIARNKPADAVDACWVASIKVTDMNLCRPAVPYFGAPRIAAGGPPTHDIVKCRLKALDPRDYRVTFSPEQWTRLQATFPTGVCDWSKPGVDQMPSQPWMTFADGPGGTPLGDPPVSTPL